MKFIGCEIPPIPCGEKTMLCEYTHLKGYSTSMARRCVCVCMCVCVCVCGRHPWRLQHIGTPSLLHLYLLHPLPPPSPLFPPPPPLIQNSKSVGSGIKNRGDLEDEKWYWPKVIAFCHSASMRTITSCKSQSAFREV
jgi:hypothetical protein